MNITQENALRKVYERNPLYLVNGMPSTINNSDTEPMSYEAFSALAYDSHMGCAIVPWCGMWLGIEEDGYTHS